MSSNVRCNMVGPSDGSRVTFGVLVRCRTALHLDYHLERNHTVEGIGSKLESETRLADFLTAQGIVFDRDWTNRIDFQHCRGIEGGAVSARPDFFLPVESVRLGALVLLGNDEFAHRRYPCDFQRLFNIVQALDQHPATRDVPIIYIRFNPHAYWVDNRLFSHSLTVGHERLLHTLRGMDAASKRTGVQLIYIHYDTIDGQLCIFNEDRQNDYAQLYADCVSQIVS